jgi:hypothetical protein
MHDDVDLDVELKIINVLNRITRVRSFGVGVGVGVGVDVCATDAAFVMFSL